MWWCDKILSVNKEDLILKVENILWGQKIEGRVAAILTTSKNGSRYVIETEEGYQETYVPLFSNDIFNITVPVYQPACVRGQEIVVWTRHVRPWIDGQRI